MIIGEKYKNENGIRKTVIFSLKNYCNKKPSTKKKFIHLSEK